MDASPENSMTPVSIWESPEATELYQAAMSELGYYKGRLDGIPGPKTKAADAEMLKIAGLPASDEARIVTVLRRAQRLSECAAELLSVTKPKSDQT